MVCLCFVVCDKNCFDASRRGVRRNGVPLTLDTSWFDLAPTVCIGDFEIAIGFSGLLAGFRKNFVRIEDVTKSEKLSFVLNGHKQLRSLIGIFSEITRNSGCNYSLTALR